MHTSRSVRIVALAALFLVVQSARGERRNWIRDMAEETTMEREYRLKREAQLKQAKAILTMEDPAVSQLLSQAGEKASRRRFETHVTRVIHAFDNSSEWNKYTRKEFDALLEAGTQKSLMDRQTAEHYEAIARLRPHDRHILAQAKIASFQAQYAGWHQVEEIRRLAVTSGTPIGSTAWDELVREFNEKVVEPYCSVLSYSNPINDYEFDVDVGSTLRPGSRQVETPRCTEAEKQRLLLK